MNSLEVRMAELLKELKEKYGAISVRAEFEAEGTKLEELLRMKEISMAADMGLELKIGGCESIRDMLEARIVGVDSIVAPMVESPYALKKYLQAVTKVFPPEELTSVQIFTNIETISACNNFEAMLEVPEIRTLQGIVIERVDLCFSSGRDESCINDEDINQIVAKTIQTAKKKNIHCTIGGGVSAHSLPFFKKLPDGYLDFYETRKVCFSAPKALMNDPEKGILKALGFELLWLKNKLSYYQNISAADTERMNHLEQRYLREIEALI